MYLHKTPTIVQKLFPWFLWSVDTGEKELFITFDDGPIPKITPWVVRQLNQFEAKATFFMVGENINRYHQEFIEVVENGNLIGNHTHNHLDGWKTNTSDYVKNIHNCNRVLDSASSKLFRPPYGKITRSQRKAIYKTQTIVMWDVLTADFDVSLKKDDCLKHTIKASSKGSIVLFHDSFKSNRNLRYVLPRFLEHFSNIGFRFKTLPV